MIDPPKNALSGLRAMGTQVAASANNVAKADLGRELTDTISRAAAYGANLKTVLAEEKTTESVLDIVG